MIGAPFESWDAVAGASYYTGLGGGELIWLIISIALCVLSILVGHKHENKINSK